MCNIWLLYYWLTVSSKFVFAENEHQGMQNCKECVWKTDTLQTGVHLTLIAVVDVLQWGSTVCV
jgi:hypothetical protein